MRKILTLFLVLLFFLLYFPKQAKAIWIKQVTQPVLSAGQSGTWDDQSVGSPFIIPDGSILKMWYQGTNGVNWRIGYTTSSDGIHWSNRQNVIDILPDDSNNKNAHNPKVVFRNNNYQMWYASSTLAISNIHINYTQSPDGINWNQLLIDIMPPSLDWEKSNGISFPFVLFSDNKYKMWYGAYGTIRGLRQWRIGYATSEDGIQWERHPDPVLEADQNWENAGSGEGIGNPIVLPENGVYHMWYHADRDIGHATSSDGIHWTKDPTNPVLSPSTLPDAFDNFRVVDPFVIKKDNIYYLYYSGEDRNGKTRIGLATSEILSFPSPTPLPTITPTPTNTPSPTPSLTPTSTPTLTPTPSIALFAPIILVPGFGASWNPRAFFSCDTGMTSGWKLAPYVSLYNRLIQTLTKNAQLQLNTDFYVYPYDFRQQLDTQSVLLKNFIDSILAKRPPGTHVRLIGHSFGGLVMRSYLSNNPFTHKAISALTVGTPHQGTVMVYPMWENGEIWTDNRLMQIALSQLIGHCRLRNSFISRDGGNPKINILTRRETVQKFAPSIKNLLPLFDYLRENGNIKSTATFIHQNDWLSLHPFSSTFFGVDFSTLSGNNKETIRFLDVTPPSQPEIRLGNWLDGKPINKETTLLGDGSVLGLSSIITGTDNSILTGSNHQDIISKKEAIEKILTFLKLDGVSPASPIPLPEETSSRFLTVALDVPAKLELTTPKKEIRESEDNILVVFDQVPGIYTLRITPHASGPAYLHLTLSENQQGISTKTYSLSLSQNKSIEYRVIYSPQRITIPRLIPLLSSTFSDNQ